MWLVIAACLCGFLVFGQSSKRHSRRGSASKNGPALSIPTDTLNVDLNITKAPIYIVDGKKNRIGAGASDGVKQWLVSEISFAVSLRSGKNAGPLLLEGVKVELYLYVSGVANDRATYRWFYGVQKLHCLVVEPDQKNRRYWASLFLPAQDVYLHIPTERSRYSLRSVEGVVVISDRENKILGRRVFGNKFKLTTDRARSLLKAVDEIQRKNGADCISLWPREKTPWAWLDADRFELPLTSLTENKPAVQAQPQPKTEEQENKE